MRWHLVYRDRVHSKISEAKKFETRGEALREARVLIDIGYEVQTLVGPNGEEISRETIEAYCRKLRP
jgi:hypothetical protein